MSFNCKNHWKYTTTNKDNIFYSTFWPYLATFLMMTKYNRNIEQKMLSIFGVTLEGIVSLWHNAVILIWWGHFDIVMSIVTYDDTIVMCDVILIWWYVMWYYVMFIWCHCQWWHHCDVWCHLDLMIQYVILRYHCHMMMSLSRDDVIVTW